MNYADAFKIIKSEGFPDEVAILVTVMCGLNMVKPMKKRHITTRGLYTKELESQFKTVFWEHAPEVIVEAKAIWEVWHTYDCCQKMQGIGGCVAKTIRQLIAEKNLRDSGN